MAKNVALFFDGTWNEAESGEEEGKNTNVHRMSQSVSSQHAGRIQLAQYCPGVGTRWFERIRGGAFGHGLDDNIMKTKRTPDPCHALRPTP